MCIKYLHPHNVSLVTFLSKKFIWYSTKTESLETSKPFEIQKWNMASSNM